MTTEVVRTERGWGGHLICGDRCRYRRNTLLVCEDIYIVVSTVGNFHSTQEGVIEEIGFQRYYETMAFMSEVTDTIYHDADVSREIGDLKSQWALGPADIARVDVDNLADKMHEAVVAEITEALMGGWFIIPAREEY